MNLWEELESCKYKGNEYLVDYLVQIIKDENLNTLEDLDKYESDYIKESNMTKEEWIQFYKDSFVSLPEIDDITNDPVALRIKQERAELMVTDDVNVQIRNIIIICALLEREVCFVKEAYNLVISGNVYLDITKPKIVRENRNVLLYGNKNGREEMLKVALLLQSRGYDVLVSDEISDKGEAFKKAIKDLQNDANRIVVCVNSTLGSVDNYIDASMFLIIGAAYYYNKRIYLYNDIFKLYKDNLISFGVVPMRRNLSVIK